MMKQAIAVALNRKEEDLFRVQYAGLNDIPIETIEDIRKIAVLPLQIYYLRSITSTKDYPFHTDFISEVVNGGEIAQTWRKGAMIIPDFSLKDLLTKNAEELLGSSIGMEFGYRTVPNKTYWKNNIQVGVPALLIPEATYEYVAPANSIKRVWLPESVELIAEKSRNNILRRWIAQSIARTLDFYAALTEETNLKELYDLVPEEKWTADARKALEGLMREIKQGTFDENSIPGMTGDDDWYS